MAAELGFQYTLTLLKNLGDTQTTLTQEKKNNQILNHLNHMQSSIVETDADDSWEVRAFAEDTSNVMGTTWPPRSYTCTYCRREFRSAQALGGHMNVHRRDRARLHQAQPNSVRPSSLSATSSSSSSSFLIPSPDFISKGGLCLLYKFPNPNQVGINTPTTLNTFIQSHHSVNNLMLPCSSSPVTFSGNDRLPGASTAFSQSCHEKANEEFSAAVGNGSQELDLELRLGQGPPARAVTRKDQEKIINMEAASFKKRFN